MRIRTLLQGPAVNFIAALFELARLRGISTGGYPARSRPGGSLAHRQWRKLRSSGQR